MCREEHSPDMGLRQNRMEEYEEKHRRVSESRAQGSASHDGTNHEWMEENERIASRYEKVHLGKKSPSGF